MAFTNTIVLFYLIPSLLMALLPIALVIILQVVLCKKSRKLGLILPILTLLLSLLLTFSAAAIQGMRGGSTWVADEYGNVTHYEEDEEDQVKLTPQKVGAVAGVFLVSNIPTVVFGGIWLYYKNRRDFKDDLKKMKIEDLE